MRRIQSLINPSSKEFQANRAHWAERMGTFRQKQEDARFKRPQRDMDRLARLNKIFVRDRIEMLLDPGSPFLELSSLAANQAYGGEVPQAGVVTGLGIVQGREVLIHANDPSVKGGAWYPLTVKKIVRALDIAIENRLPVIHLADSAGGFLPMQSEMFADRYHAGRVFRNQCIISKLGLPQLAIVFGHCTAGGAYVPALSDFSVMVRGNSGIFLGGPPLVKAATGEVVSADELGGPDVQTGQSGTADYAADTETEAIALGREIVAQWPRPQKARLDWQEPEAPYYDPEELYGILPADNKMQFDIREVIARVVDGSRFHEYQPNYGSTLVCGFARIWGWQVGVLGNNGVLFSDSALKATHFMQLCDQRGIPLVFLQNITGYMVGKEYEKRGITKDGAKMIMMLSACDVPKLTVIVNGSYGAGNYGMCGRAFDARMLFMWPNARISIMGAEQAARTLSEVKRNQLARQGEELSAEQARAIEEPIVAKYTEESDAYYATSQIWDDGVLDPVDTRNALGMALTASLNAPLEKTGTGIFRF